MQATMFKDYKLNGVASSTCVLILCFILFQQNSGSFCSKHNFSLCKYFEKFLFVMSEWLNAS